MNGVNEKTPAASESNQGATAPAVPNSSPGTTVNLRKLRTRAGIAIRPATEPAPQPKVFDASLEDDDLRISVRVGAITRVEKLAEFKVERTLYGMAHDKGLFKDLDNLLEEIYHSTAIKLNRKLQPRLEAEDAASPPKAKVRKMIPRQSTPPALSDEEFDQIFAHLDRRLRKGDTRTAPGLRVPLLGDQVMESRRNARQPNRQQRRQSSPVKA